MKSDSKKQSPQVFRALRPFRAFAAALSAVAAIQAAAGYHDGWYYPDPVDPVTVANAARGFVSMVQNASGGHVFGGCEVAGVYPWRLHQWEYANQVFEDYNEETGYYDDDNFNIDASGPAAWLITLAPSGHVFMASLDCMPPVAYFSEEDFAFDVDWEIAEAEDGFDGSIVDGILDELEAESDHLYFRSFEMNSDWDALSALGSAPSSASTSGTSATSGGASAQGCSVAPPILATRYNQSQPFNDYAPVFDPDPAEPDLSDLDATFDDWESWQYAQYRGRASAGCLAISGAQMFRHFRWPAILDSYSISQQLIDDGDSYDCLSCAYGGGSVNWDLLSAWDGSGLCGGFQKDGEGYLTDDWFDNRDIWDAAARHEVAKLCFWLATISKTKFGVFDEPANNLASSRATMEAFASGAARWYATGENRTLDGSVLPEVAGQLMRGVPLLLQPGLSAFDLFDHIAVADGVVRFGSMFIVHVNFGWGGQDDAWFAVERLSNWDGSSPSSVRLGFVPRPKPQLDELPQVLSLNQSVSWRFPDFWTNRLDGWIVRVTPFCGTAETRTIDFSSVPVGTLEGPCIRFDTAPTLGGEGGVLHVATSNTCYWTAPERAVLSSRSSVSFMLGAQWTKNTVARLQAEYGDNVWTNVATWAFETNAVVKAVKVRAFVGDHAGECARFRIFVEENENDRTKFDLGMWEFDDFTVSDAYFTQQPHVWTWPAEIRSMSLSNLQLEPGSRVEISVEPVFAATGTTATGATTATDAAMAEISDVVIRFVEGVASVPVPALESMESVSLTFSTNGILPWSWSGDSILDDKTIYGNTPKFASYANTRVSGYIDSAGRPVSRNTLTAIVEVVVSPQCVFSDSANFHFTVASTNWFKSSVAFDQIFVDFIGFDGSSARVFATTNDYDNVNGGLWSYAYDYTVPLSDVAGKPGMLHFTGHHTYGQFTGSNFGMFVSGMAVDGALVPSTPDAVSEPITMEALGKPQFLSVSTAHGTPVRDGMFRECSFGNNVVYVKCSPLAVDLRAYSSHPLLLDEEQDVSVHRLGGGEFALEIHGIGVPQAEARSRVILQLEALDANGTATQTDLVLRFSGEAGNEAQWAAEWNPVSGAQPAGGQAAPETVMVPYDWFVENGIVAAGARDSAFTRAAAADGDGDGVPNAVEWICGTDPDSSQSALRADISFPSGANVPDVDWSPKDSVREGYEVVLEGRGELGSGEWEPADETRHHFFRATVRRE